MKSQALATVFIVGLLAGSCGNQVGLQNSSSATVASPETEAASVPPAPADKTVVEVEQSTQQPIEEPAPAFSEAPGVAILEDVPPVEMEPSPSSTTVEELVSPPKLVTGAYLASCQWRIAEIMMSCGLRAVNPSHALKPSQISFVVRKADGEALAANLFQVTSSMDSDSLSYQITFQAATPNVSLTFTNHEDPNAAPVNVLSSDVTTGKPLVIAYEGDDFGGASKGFELGSFIKATHYPEFAQSFASLRVPAGFAVRLCHEMNLAHCHSLTGDLPRLTELKNMIGSVEVFESGPLVTAFDSYHLSGMSAALPVGFHDYVVIPDHVKDKISSLHVPVGLVVDGCLSTDGTGDCRTYEAGSINISDRNDLIKSLRVRLP